MVEKTPTSNSSNFLPKFMELWKFVLEVTRPKLSALAEETFETTANFLHSGNKVLFQTVCIMFKMLILL